MVNLKNLNEKSEQEVFDWIVSNLLKQGKKSLDKNGSTCKYRGEEGCKCAAGWIVSDDEYDKSYEGMLWNSSIFGFSDLKHTEIIMELQSNHDENDVEDWKSVFEMVADNYGLSSKAISDFDKL